ncbi:MAG: transposase [Verrucomicrobia bacterium]|nr:transposase [Verrucomicrobiota bacterium]
MFWGADQEEFCAYVTDLLPEEATPAQIVLTYRKRGDAENVFDELKNQWGCSGFCSGNGVVTGNRAIAAAHVQPVEPVRTGAQRRRPSPRSGDQPGRTVDDPGQTGEKWTPENPETERRRQISWEAISLLCKARTLVCHNCAAVGPATTIRTLPVLEYPKQSRPLAPKTNPLILNCGI